MTGSGICSQNQYTIRLLLTTKSTSNKMGHVSIEAKFTNCISQLRLMKHVF